MPRFATKPDVFPPVVPAVNDRGDVPTYAFSDNGIVLAWTHPDDLGAERDYRGFGYEITPEKRLTVGVNAYFERPSKSAHQQAIEAAEEEIARLRRVYANFDFTGVITGREDRVEPLTVHGVDGIWQVIGCSVVGEKKRPHDFTLRRERILLPQRVSSTESKLVTLKAIPPDGPVDYPIQEALTHWRGAFTSRVPQPADHDYAAWYFDLGFLLTGIVSDRGSRSYSDAGYMDGDRLGADVRVEVLPPQRRETLDVEGDLAESLRLAAHDVPHPTTLGVTSRQIRCDEAKLEVLDGYEIVAGPENPAENIFAQEPDFVLTEDEIHPGTTTRVAYLALGDGWYTRLNITAGARATDSLERWWRQLCERLWIWTP
jgi:hypothetical protein